MDKHVLALMVVGLLLVLGSASAAEVGVIIKQKMTTMPLQSADITLMRVQEFTTTLQTVYLMNVTANTYYMAMNNGPSFVIGTVDDSQIKNIAERPDVEYVALDRKVELFERGSFGPVSTLSDINDKYNFDLLPDGKGVSIALLDTGYPIRKDVSSHVKAGYDFTNTNIFDDNGHSTAISYIYESLSPNASLYTYKVMVNGEATTGMILMGIEQAVKDGRDIISLSIGGVYYGGPDPMVDSLNWAADRGTISVVAAGNCGSCASLSCGGYSSVTTPGIAKKAITVGATDYYDSVACFSGPGDEFTKKPDVVALGTDILLPGISQGTRIMSGTSFSTPIVGAFVADLLSNFKSQLTAQAQSPVTSIKTAITASAIDYGEAGWDPLYGNGVIDATGAIQELSSIPVVIESTASRFSDLIATLVLAGLIVVVSLYVAKRRGGAYANF